MSEPRLSHQECWELLPWLVNDSLDGAEAVRVGDHLEVCAICREEVRACRELAGLLADGTARRPSASAVETAADLLSPERGFSRLAARLDGALDGARRDDDHPPAPARRKTRRWRALLTATPRPVRALVAAQMAALLVLAALAGQVRLGSGSKADSADGGEAVATFRTLSSSPAAPAQRQRLRLVFSEEAALTEVRHLLVEAGARLVDGPSPFGVYTVELPATGDDGETQSERLARLRRHPAVVFAEPAAAAGVAADTALEEQAAR